MEHAAGERPTPWLHRAGSGAGFAGVLLVGLGAWLLFPRSTTRPEREGTPVRVVVVDASAGVRRTRPGWLPWVRRRLEAEALGAEAARERFAVVSFASDVGTCAPVGDPAGFLERLRGGADRPLDLLSAAGSDAASELARALEVAARLSTARGLAPAEVEILGDGRFTGPDPHAALAELRRAGARVELRRPPPPERTDLAVRELRLPATIEAGAPLVGVAQVAFARGTAPVERAWLELEVDDAASVRTSRLPFRVPATDGELLVVLNCGPAAFGRTEVRVRARLAPGPDPVPENDAARSGCVAAGELVVGVVAAADRLAAAREWLAPSGTSALGGIQLVFAPRAELPGLLRDLDALVTFDLAVRDLPAPLVEDFVLAGGGWLATTGWRFLEDWIPGETRTGLGRLLPLEPAPLEQGPRDVILLVDGSGSMEGEPFETVRAACLDLVAAALPSDEVRLRFFTGGLEAARLIKPRSSSSAADEAGAAEAARRLLDLRVPSGETHILLSLEELAATRRPGGPEALVLLLTDGREREAMPDPAARAEAVRASLQAVGATLRVIAVGRDADLEFLGFLTPPGEEVARPEDLADMRALFRREISGARWREGPALTVAWGPAPAGSLAAEIAGGDRPPVPPAERLVKDVLAPGAEALWVDEQEKPVLGVERAGLGRTALVSSQPGAGWAPAWSGRYGGGEPAAFAALLRWLGRGTRRRESGPHLALEEGWLVLSGLDEGWPVRVEAELVDAGARDGAVVGRVMLDPAPIPEGATPLARRATRLGPGLLERLRGVGPVAVVALPGGGLLREPVDPGPAAEFSGGERDLDLEGGSPGGPGPGPSAESGREAHPGGPWVLLLGLLFLAGGAIARSRGQGIGRPGR